MMHLTNCKKGFIYLLLFHIKIFVLLCLLSPFLLNTILFGKNSRLPKNVKNGTTNSHVSFTTISFWQLPRQLSQLNTIQPGALHSVVTSFSSPSKRAALQSFLDFNNLDMVEDYKAFILQNVPQCSIVQCFLKVIPRNIPIRLCIFGRKAQESFCVLTVSCQFAYDICVSLRSYCLW